MLVPRIPGTHRLVVLVLVGHHVQLVWVLIADGICTHLHNAVITQAQKLTASINGFGSKCCLAQDGCCLLLFLLLLGALQAANKQHGEVSIQQ